MNPPKHPAAHATWTGRVRRWRSFLQRLRNRPVMLYSLFLPIFLALSLGGVGETIYRYALVIIGFSLIIFVHELGHFLVARACSVRCETFSIGIGPRMLGWRKGVGFTFGNEPEPRPAASDESAATPAFQETAHDAMTGDLQQIAKPNVGRGASPTAIGETDYRLSWLPFGGYVKMLGQDDMDPTATSEDPRAFNRRPIWQRMCIISAGVIMNVIFAAVVFAIVFRIGVAFPPAVVGEVAYDSPAEKVTFTLPSGQKTQGLQIGDKILAINGKRPSEGFLEFNDLAIATALSAPGEKVRLDIERGGQVIHDIELTPTVGSNGMLAVGVMPMPSLKLMRIIPETLDNFGSLKTELAKIRPGDRITALDGTRVNDYAELMARLQNPPGQSVRFTLTNQDTSKPPVELTLPVELEARPGAKELSGILNMYPRCRIRQVIKDKPADQAGLREGDIITRIGVIEYPTQKEFTATLEKNARRTVDLTVLRDDKLLNLQVTPAEINGVGRIAVVLESDMAHPFLAAAPEFAAVARGSRIVSVDGREAKNWNDVFAAARNSGGKAIALVFETPRNTLTTVELPAETTPGARQRELAKLAYRVEILDALEPVEELQKSHSVVGAVNMGLSHTGRFIVQTYLTLRGLFYRTVPVSELHGPLGIAKIGYEVQERGPIWLLFVMAMVSVNLAVANFLPLPIVDGGLFVLLIIEKLRGRPLPARVLNAINMVGLFLLGGLFLYVTVNNDLGLFFRGH